MGNQNTRNQDNVPLAQFNISDNYQMGVDANNQYSINSNYSAPNNIHNFQQAQQQNVKVVHNEQQQSIPNIPPIPQIPPQPIQLGIPVIQSLEIVQIPQQPITNDLKDQPFHIKKNEVLKALIIYLIMQIISFALSIYLCIQFDRSSTFGNFASPICIISGLGNILVVISAKYQKFQQNPIAIVNSCLIIVFQSSSLVSYFFYQSQYSTSNSYFSGFIFLILILQSSTNCIVIGITIFYFVFEQKQIRFEIYFLMLCFAGFIAIMVDFVLLFFVCTGFIFGTILMIVLQQLMNGRFQLKKNQSFGLCNSIYLGLLVPCNIF
ncbi:unnamed protein product [Paramecium pentaurelia]|uniref:Transmembrane protein n=1 Tax=Paramecium pentaurelia TaxID=43138 RepID=A0A8S1XR06_9CILI|nr:unnamed protein product [Paramecium pentaurelia]